MTITAIEDGFLAALEPLRAEGVRTLQSYADSGLEDIDDIAGTLRLLPAVLVVWGGLQVEQLNEMDADTEKVSILVCDRNMRGEESARRGDGASPGAYHWLDRCRALLRRRMVVSGYTPARLTASGLLAKAKGLVIYEQTHEIRRRTTV